MDKFNSVIAISGTACTFLLGGWDAVLNTLLILMVIDYLTGVIKGYMTRELNSVRGMKGLCKKLFILFILIIAVSLDRMLGTGEHMFRTLVCFFYISNEGISILENASTLGVPIPHQIKNALEQIKDK